MDDVIRVAQKAWRTALHALQEIATITAAFNPTNSATLENSGQQTNVATAFFDTPALSPGRYLVLGSITVGAFSGATMADGDGVTVSLRKNGVTIASTAQQVPAGTSTGADAPVTAQATVQGIVTIPAGAGQSVGVQAVDQNGHTVSLDIGLAQVTFVKLPSA